MLYATRGAKPVSGISEWQLQGIATRYPTPIDSRKNCLASKRFPPGMLPPSCEVQRFLSPLEASFPVCGCACGAQAVSANSAGPGAVNRPPYELPIMGAWSRCPRCQVSALGARSGDPGACSARARPCGGSIGLRYPDAGPPPRWTTRACRTHAWRACEHRGHGERRGQRRRRGVR